MKRTFLQGSGKDSMMRLGFFIIILAGGITALGAVAGYLIGIIIGSNMLEIGTAIGGLAGLVGTLLVPAFGGKAYQARGEARKPPESGAGQ